MLFSPTPRIEELIVRTLAVQPNLSASALLSAVQKLRGGGSLPSVYQALRKLEQDGIVFRHQHTYSLALDWVLELSSFVDSLYDRYTQPDVLGALPSEGERPKKWKFSTIASVVPFWTHLVLCSVQSSESREVHEYMDHIWFHLVSSSVEARLIKAIQTMKISHFLFCGHASPLDKSYEREIDKGSMYLRFNERPFKDEHYLSCIGPYVIRIILRERDLGTIETFYREASGREPRASELTELIRTDMKISLTIEHSIRRANAVRKAFQPFLIGAL